MKLIAAVAGTFDVLHEGHRRLLQRAFEVGDEVVVGITSDRLAGEHRDDVVPLYMRQQALERYLTEASKPWRVCVIDDVYGPREEMDRAEVLVVSSETLANGRLVNDDRRARGVPPLELSVVPLVLAEDGEKLSARAILAGRYARDGTAGAADIAVGSLNHVKVEAVRAVMERIFGSVRITAVDVPSGVPAQPFEGQTREGALNRARAAIGAHDFGVGIEAGVFEQNEGLYDFQYCAVIDRAGRVTVGVGPGFAYPLAVAELVRQGRTVSEAVQTIYGCTDIGHQQGAIGLLSHGLLDRQGLTEQSVIAAMVPRLGDEQNAPHS